MYFQNLSKLVFVICLYKNAYTSILKNISLNNEYKTIIKNELTSTISRSL